MSFSNDEISSFADEANNQVSILMNFSFDEPLWLQIWI